jgi:single-stranded-DNA-specific exonuclease
VIGIVAAQLVERIDKPVILFSTPPGQAARGSARSVAGINITEAIASQAMLLEGFGGHPMAAGLSLQPDRIPDFKRGLVRAIAAQSPVTPQTGLRLDGLIELNAISPDLVSNIERMAPFGSGNPPVILATRNLTLSGYTAVGKHGEHLLVTLEDQKGYTQQAIWWQGANQPIPEHSFDLAFTARTATYRGQKGIQLEWIDWRISSDVPVSLSTENQTIAVFDHRHESNPQNTITTLRSSHGVQIWCETADSASISGKDRLSLSPCDILVIWSPPPSPSVLRDIIQQTKPRSVYLFGHSTTMDQPVSFLTRLTGLCKYALNKQAGQLDIAKLAAATNQRVETVIAGLLWLQSHGHLEIIEQQPGHVKISEGVISAQDSRQPPDAELQALLRESAAYRKYFLREDKDRLINFPRQPSKPD